MKPEQIVRLIECLESARQRPAMYFGRVEVDTAISFLGGYRFTLNVLFGIGYNFLLREAWASRGWEMNAQEPAHVLSEQGWPADKVIDELLAVEIEILQQLLMQSRQQESVASFDDTEGFTEAIVAQIRKLQSAEPFRPFRISLRDGRSLLVIEPSMLSISPSGKILVWHSGFDSLEIVDLGRVRQVDP